MNFCTKIDDFQDDSDYNKLHIAISMGQKNFQIIKYLIEQGADVNVPTKRQMDTPIQLASIFVVWKLFNTSLSAKLTFVL